LNIFLAKRNEHQNFFLSIYKAHKYIAHYYI